MLHKINNLLDTLISKIDSKIKFDEAETKELIKKVLRRSLVYRVVKDILIFVLGGIALIIPTCSLIQLQKSNEILQKQTEWLISNNNRKNYQDYLDRLYGKKNFGTEQRQLSLELLTQLSLDFGNYQISKLDLQGLLLKNFNKTVKISSSQFSGQLFDSYSLNDYEIYRSTFKNIIAGEKNKADAKISFHEIRNVEIFGSKFFNSNFYNTLFINSKLFSEIKDSEFIGVAFCGSRLNMRFKNVYMKNVKFFCDDDLTTISYSWFGKLIGFASGYSMVTDLVYTDFKGATLENIDFSYANLENVINLNKAKAIKLCGNEKTIWPKGISFPNCADIVNIRTNNNKVAKERNTE